MNDSFNDLLKIAANLEFEKECSQAVEVDSMQHNEVNLRVDCIMKLDT